MRQLVHRPGGFVHGLQQRGPQALGGVQSRSGMSF